MFRILLIDDEPMIKIGVRKLLEDTDYIIAGTANNGMEALEYLKTNSVDIIMTDLKMPVMNGLELIHQLNALSFDGAILVLSNYSDFELVREALTAGALDYILKTDMTRSRLLKYLEKKPPRDRFSIMTQQGVKHVAIEDIYYFETYERKVRMVCRDGKYVFKGTIEETYKKIDQSIFAYPHQSFLVNFLHIDFLKGYDIFIDNGPA